VILPVAQPFSRPATPPESIEKKDESAQEEEKLAPAPVPVWFLERLRFRVAVAPFWFVSFAFHGLVIALAVLISMTIKPPFEDERITIVTTLRRPIDLAEIEPEVQMNLPGALTAHAGDLDAQANAKIVIPEDIMARAEPGDHFETINPEVVD